MPRRGLPVTRPSALAWLAGNVLWVYWVGRVTSGFIIGIFRDDRSEALDKLIVAVFVPPIALLAIVAVGLLTLLWLIRLERYVSWRRHRR